MTKPGESPPEGPLPGEDPERTDVNKNDIKTALGLNDDPHPASPEEKTHEEPKPNESEADDKRNDKTSSEPTETEPKADEKDDDEVDLPEELIPGLMEEEETTEEEEPSDIEQEFPQPETLKDQKDIDAFKKMRQTIVDLRKDKSASSSKEVEELREKLVTAEKQLGSLSLSEDPQFKQKYDTPMNKKYSQIIRLVKEFEGDQKVAQEALRMDVKSRSNFLQQEMPEVASVILPIYMDIDDLNAERTAALQDFQKTKKSLDAQRATSIIEAAEKSLGQIKTKLVEERHFLLKESTDENWNKRVNQRISSGKVLLEESNSGEAMLEIALKARLADEYRDMYLAAAKLLKDSNIKLNRTMAKKPRIKGDQTKPDKSRPKDNKGRSGEDVASIIESRLGT